MTTSVERRRLSAGQERLWFLQRFNAAAGIDGLYNEYASVRFDGVLNVAAMCQAFAAVARRHESLRWLVEDERGSCVAVARDEPFPTCVRLIDLTAGGDMTVRERACRRYASDAARVPFDLGAGPLFRVLLFRLSGQEWAMALVMHHIITDTWSIQIVVEDVCRAYAAIVTGRPAAIGDLDYGEPPSEEARGDELERTELAYWTAKLASVPEPVSLPRHRPCPERRTFVGAKQYFALRDETIAPLRARMREERVTFFMLWLAIWKAYLGLVAGRRDLVVGATIAERDKAAERRIGYFANTLAIRTALRPSEPFRSYLRDVRTAVIEALDHRQVPFERVVRALKLPRAANRHPLFEVMFVVVSAPVLDIALPGVAVRLTPDHITLGLSKFNLALSCWQRGAGVEGLMDYSTELYDAREMAAHVARFEAFAALALADPDRPVSALLPTAGVAAGVLEDLRPVSFVR
jgi:hypothetical protein